MRHLNHPPLALAVLLASACGPSADAPAITYPGMSAHARYLPLVGTPHEPSRAGPMSCESCHTTPSTFAEFTCTGTCHTQAATDPIHSGLTGYGYASAACYGCHKDGTAGAPANHSSAFFPIGSSSRHAGVGCRQCHTDLGRPNDPLNFACASCHDADGAAHTISGYLITGTRSSQGSAITTLPWRSDHCLRCHADSQVDRVASHPGGEDAFGKGQHRTAGCLTCHTQLRADKRFGTSFNAEGGCTTCHSNGTGGN
jgi:hypothetical protein